MIVVRLSAGAIKRQMIVMTLVPAIVAAYWMALSFGLFSVKSLGVFAAASMMLIVIYAVFQYYCWFKIRNPIVFLLDEGGSGFYMPTFNKIAFRVAQPFSIDVSKDGVRVSPKIIGLPNFAEQDGVTFIQTNRGYEVCQSSTIDGR